MKFKLFLFFVLACGVLFAQEGGTLTIPKDKQSSYLVITPNSGMVYKRKCDACGEMAPTNCLLTINIGFSPQLSGNSIFQDAAETYMAPYKTEYSVCLKCIFKALGFKPEGKDESTR